MYSKDKWAIGVPFTRFIWHGEWNAPEVAMCGTRVNYCDFEDIVWHEVESIFDTKIDDWEDFDIHFNKLKHCDKVGIYNKVKSLLCE